MKPRILVSEPIVESVIDKLKTHGEVVVGEKGVYQQEDALIRDLPQFDALLCMLSTPLNRKVLEAAPNLKAIATHAVGFDNIDVGFANQKGIKVANTPDVLTEACGDFAMALLLALSRRFREAEDYLRAGKFTGWEPLGFLGPELRGKKLGIIGMGRIGTAFARRARAFGMNITYHNRKPVDSDLEKELKATFIPDLPQILKESDVISLNCPLTPETHHLMSAETLGMMKKEALLINISRGAVVDEAALAEALYEGKIAGAGLDVFEHEPEVHPNLLTAPNCLMLPHIASATYETREAIGMLAADAIISILQGKPDSEIPNLIKL
jgi:glyoxylate reductase